MSDANDSKLRTTLPDVSGSAGGRARVARNLFRMLATIAAATLLSLLLERFSFNESNCIIIYLLGVVFVAYVTDGYLYSITASVLSVLFFNYFFIIPFFTFYAYGRDYPITFAVMLLAALLSSSMTSRIKMLKEQSEHRELRLHFLNRITRKLMFVAGFREIAEVAAGEVADFLDASVMVAVVDMGTVLKYKHIVGEYAFGSIEDDVAGLDALRSGEEGNFASGRLYSSAGAHFLPICGQKGVLGMLGVAYRNKEAVSENARTFLATVCAHISVALERERLRQKQEQAKFAMERERLRSNLLRGISHDLRTPLTGILGSAGALRDHFATLDEETKLGFVGEIIDEAEWLRQLVENTLYLTRMEERGIRLDKELQPVEELVAAAAERCRKRTDCANLRIEMPGNFVMVPADATLIVQALINLLDNAFRHSPDGAQVTLKVSESPPDVVFEVIDRGVGIAPEAIDRIFDRFSTVEKRALPKGRQKGIGLGLAVCKSVVEAHGGKIAAASNPGTGTTFRFTLPMEEP